MGKQTLLSVIFVPDHQSAWLPHCVDHCAARGYHLAAIATTWADVLKMVLAGHVQVIVTGQRKMIPTDLTPRLEVVDEVETHSPVPPSQRRITRRRNLEADR